MSSGALDDLKKRRYEAASKGFQDILKNASKLNLMKKLNQSHVHITLPHVRMWIVI